MFLPRSVTRRAAEEKQLQPTSAAKRTLPSEKKVLVEDFRSEASAQASSSAENADHGNNGKALRHWV